LIRSDHKEKPMTVLATDAFRRIGPGDAVPNDFVVPYYLDDRKLRVSVARVHDRLYAFDDLCTCTPEEPRSCANATARSSTSPLER
jgi:hypothetical protein